MWGGDAAADLELGYRSVLPDSPWKYPGGVRLCSTQCLVWAQHTTLRNVLFYGPAFYLFLLPVWGTALALQSWEPWLCLWELRLAAGSCRGTVQNRTPPCSCVFQMMWTCSISPMTFSEFSQFKWLSAVGGKNFSSPWKCQGIFHVTGMMEFDFLPGSEIHWCFGSVSCFTKGMFFAASTGGFCCVEYRWYIPRGKF